jgi:hypothetical protein
VFELEFILISILGLGAHLGGEEPPQEPEKVNAPRWNPLEPKKKKKNLCASMCITARRRMNLTPST